MKGREKERMRQKREGKREEEIMVGEVRGVFRLKILGKGGGSGSRWGLIAYCLFVCLLFDTFLLWELVCMFGFGLMDMFILEGISYYYWLL